MDNIMELNKLIYARVNESVIKLIFPEETRTEIQNLNGKLG